jgi:KDO2-lipid IV(A) lauroyltransferase
VQTNYSLCFPERSEAERRKLTQQTFVYFAQAWLDRAWLWHAPKGWVQRRVKLTGAVSEVAGTDPTVIFLPHFVGLDAAWAGVALAVPRLSTTIYTDQSNKLVDQWILRGRQRFGHLRLFGRVDGVKPIVAALREGQPLYLLPDMDFGPEDSVFVPFYGIPTATVPSLSRFARLGRAKVVPLLPRITAAGYEVQVLPAWDDFPSDDAVLDTARMNASLQDYIATMPAQYYWVHKRFKTRPEGEPSLY